MTIWKILKMIGLLIGITFFVVAIGYLGPERILYVLLSLKGWVIPILINSLGWTLLYTAAWRNYFSNLRHKIPFFHLLKIKVCGEAVNLMTPVGFIAGDPVRVLLLRKQLGATTRLGSVIVDRMLHTLATVSFVLFGMIVTFSQRVLIQSDLRWIIVGCYGVLVIFLALLVLEIMRGHGFRRFHAILQKMGIEKRLPKWDAKLHQLNSELSDFAGGRFLPLLQALFFHLLGRILGVIEIGIIFAAFTGSPRWLLALMLTALTSMTHFLFSFVPGAFGIVESMYASFFYYFHLDPVVGVSMELTRRLRGLFWVGVGILLMNSHFKDEKGATQKS